MVSSSDRPEVRNACALAKLLGKAGVSFQYLSDESDSGLLLYQLGENEAAHSAANGLQKKIDIPQRLEFYRDKLKAGGP